MERDANRLHHELFPVEVLSVDYERKSLTLQDFRDGLVFHEVTIFPAVASSIEELDVVMPEQGAIGLAGTYAYSSGFRITMVVSWLHTQSYKAIDAIANRPISGEYIQGWTNRRRGSYRKAFPGQRTATYTEGFSQRIASGWDQQAADYSRDKIDADKRQRSQITGRNVNYSDAGVTYQGSVSRPGATNLHSTILPDGSTQNIAYLQPGAAPADRYISGKPDVIPYSEHTELVQEFALDYPVPYELLQTALLDNILGTTADPWGRTKVTPADGTLLAFDSESFMINQGWDHPDNTKVVPLGPTTNEGPTPQRRAYILEKSAGTLVGYSVFDQSTYGKVLKPQLFINTSMLLAKFGSSVESAYNQVNESADHVEARLAASCYAIRFPYEQNTTRLNVTKEGLVQMEVGSTLPKENILLNSAPEGAKAAQLYEYPAGAGRSLEAHLVGSAKLVIGKNRDEEEALDVQALGQVVLRLGADDTSTPNLRRTVGTQIRSRQDAPGDRTLQYWDKDHVALSPGDAGNNQMWTPLSASKFGASKVGAENISLRGAFDGGTVLRLGAKNSAAKRRHLVNGYADAQGLNQYGVGDSNRIDSKSYRTDYGAGDNKYAFHDMTQAGISILSAIFTNPYVWSGTPITTKTPNTTPMDAHGQSLDLHTVRDVLLRLGANTDSGQSLLLDTNGGLVFTLGQDQQGRSITAALDGGIEITIKPNKQGRALQLQIDGDICISHNGNLQYYSGGDLITEVTTHRSIVKTDRIETQQKKVSSSLARDTRETYGDAVNQQPGAYESYGDENT